MALAKQNIPISLLKGVDTKTEQKQVMPGKLLVLENGRFDNIGQLRKRFGFQTFPLNIASGGSIKAGFSGATFLNELLEFDGNFLYSFSESNGLWTNKGQITSLEVGLSPVVRNTFQQTTPDCAIHSSGLKVFTWEDSSGGCRYSVVDTITGQSVVQNALVSSVASRPKPFALGAYLVILFVNTSNHHLQRLTIPVVTPLSPLAIDDVATNLNVTNPNYDGVLFSMSLWIAYNNTDGGGGISVRSLNPFLIETTGTDITGENADVAVTIFVDSVLSNIWVVYYNATSVKYFILNASFGTLLSPTVIETVSNVVRIVGQSDSGLGNVWYEVSAMLASNTLIRTNTATSGGSVGTPSVYLRSVGLAGKPFIYNKVTYLTVTFDSVEQPTYFTVTSGGRVVAKFVPSNGGGLLTRSLVPEIVSPSLGSFVRASLQKDLLTTISGNLYTQTGVVESDINFNSENTFYRAEMGRNLHITGGILSMYDGALVVEHGFNIFPEGVTFTQSNAGGFLGNGSVATQYQFSCTFEWTDNQGQIHRSAPSTPITVSFSSGITTGSVVLTIPTLRITSKTGVRVVVYRTEGNGTIFYQDSSTTSPIANDPTVDTVMFTSTQADTDLIGNPLLYTTGGVVDNIAAPAVSLITQYKDRLILVPSENKRSILFSEDVVPGTPVQFSDLFSLNIDQRGGDITGIEQLDDKLILFKNSLQFYIVGDGPDNTGAQNDFTEAQLITTDSGCQNARSIVVMPSGLMYQSEKGIYRLQRSLGVDYIGADVEAFNSFEITSSVLIPLARQVRFTTNQQLALVYDYYSNQWAIYTNVNAADAAIFNGQYTYINPNGLVFQENESIFTDNGQFIKMRLTSSWLSMAQLQGFQRCYRMLFLGDYKSPHVLQVGVAYDFDPTIVQQDLINTVGLFRISNYGDDSPYGAGNFFGSNSFGGDFPQYQFRIDLRRQKCMAIQFSIEDVQTSNFGEGMSFSAFSLMVGAKQGSNKVPTPRIFT